MNSFTVLDVFERQENCPSFVRYRLMAERLFAQPNNWVPIAKEKNLDDARLVIRAMKRKQCLARCRSAPDGSYIVFGCFWRLENEDS